MLRTIREEVTKESDYFLRQILRDKIKEDELFDGTLDMHTEFLFQSVKGNEGENIVC